MFLAVTYADLAPEKSKFVDRAALGDHQVEFAAGRAQWQNDNLDMAYPTQPRPVTDFLDLRAYTAAVDAHLRNEARWMAEYCEDPKFRALVQEVFGADDKWADHRVLNVFAAVEWHPQKKYEVSIYSRLQRTIVLPPSQGSPDSEVERAQYNARRPKER